MRPVKLQTNGLYERIQQWRDFGTMRTAGSKIVEPSNNDIKIVE